METEGKGVTERKSKSMKENLIQEKEKKVMGKRKGKGRDSEENLLHYFSVEGKFRKIKANLGDFF